ncbi:hypothetical protein BK004_03470 [bacterium CG10_46_32]|nr:MAG: hypothetical protein BK004_03470 [bacterium CG10_46_32]PIR55940.1 MAG: type II toxin-antitoxin system RelE/ParE family toxin [Parcubacteria group bacterium CG10_big_fil_rev_8_21_14_0_10_46_32]
MEIRFFSESVRDFIGSLEEKTRARVYQTIDLFYEAGHTIGLPHSKKIAKDLFELRIRSVQEVRILYTYKQASVVLLHAFIKQSQKIPQKEIKLALQRLSAS